jgi:hypothetical protein
VLDRGLFVGLAGDAGHDQVAVVGRGLRAHDHVVAGEDAGPDHGVAAHLQHEQFAVAGELGGKRQ